MWGHCLFHAPVGFQTNQANLGKGICEKRIVKWEYYYHRKNQWRHEKEFRFVVVIEFQKRGAVYFQEFADLGLIWQTESEYKELERWQVLDAT